jgi:dienelactone hydrolase
MKLGNILLGALLLLPAACADGTVNGEEEMKVRTETVEYRHGDAVLEGYLAWPEGADDKRPGVLIVHAWMGLGDFVRERAQEMARRGRVAFALDMYGKGIRPKNRQEASQQATLYRSDRPLMRARAQAGLAYLAGREQVDPGRIAAIGFCFGGGTVLELARSGADVAGVVSFHGNLDTPDPEDARKITAKVLVLHGADDPHVPDEQVNAFIAEMRNARVDWQLVHYGGAVHAFTEPAAGDDPSRGAAYDETVARRSWAAMETFFTELFGE